MRASCRRRRSRVPAGRRRPRPGTRNRTRLRCEGLHRRARRAHRRQARRPRLPAAGRRDRRGRLCRRHHPAGHHHRRVPEHQGALRTRRRPELRPGRPVPQRHRGPRCHPREPSAPARLLPARRHPHDQAGRARHDRGTVRDHPRHHRRRVHRARPHARQRHHRGRRPAQLDDEPAQGTQAARHLRRTHRDQCLDRQGAPRRRACGHRRRVPGSSTRPAKSPNCTTSRPTSGPGCQRRAQRTRGAGRALSCARTDLF